MQRKNSKTLFEEAKQYIPGGVNSPARAFNAVQTDPVFITKGAGSKITDADENEYIDYVGSWGPHLFGHNPPFIKEAVLKAVENGTSFGAPTPSEIDMAKIILELVPSMDRVRMVNSGTEAAMSAVRVARGYTGREKFIKFEGCYHGHADYFLIKAGSGALTLGVPTSPGVTKGNAADTLLANYNDIESVKKLVNEHKGEIAAVMLEPVAGNMGVIQASPEFLRELRTVCDDEGIVLIFDEVMTGFRLAAGGAQERFAMKPDMSIFGKVIGGGLPVGAFGGKKEIMDKVAPVGPVYQAGTLSGNPLAMAAGYAALKHIRDNPSVFDQLEEKSARLEQGFRKNLDSLNLPYQINRVGSMICMFFTDSPVTDFQSATTSNTELFAAYFREMLDYGIYLPCAQFEAAFVSTAHSEEDIEKTIAAHYDSLKKVTG